MPMPPSPSPPPPCSCVCTLCVAQRPTRLRVPPCLSAPPHCPQLPPPKRPFAHNPRSLVHLNVGGTLYTTLTSTLLAVPNSFFWGLLHSSNPEEMLPRTANGEFFLDRNGKVRPAGHRWARCSGSSQRMCHLVAHHKFLPQRDTALPMHSVYGA